MLSRRSFLHVIRGHGPRAVVVAVACGAVSVASADVLNVDDDAPGGDGSSWTEAFRHLQDALDAAQPGSAFAATGSGGAVSASGGPSTIERYTFGNNREVAQYAESAGGGALGIEETRVVDCVFSGNSAWNGGAIFVTGDAEIRGSTLEGNSAERGGAIFRRARGLTGTGPRRPRSRIRRFS